jgi:hypothetical protein
MSEKGNRLTLPVRNPANRRPIYVAKAIPWPASPAMYPTESAGPFGRLRDLCILVKPRPGATRRVDEPAQIAGRMQAAAKQAAGA